MRIIKNVISERRLVEKTEWILNEFDNNIMNLMHNHYEQKEKREQLLLSSIYNKLQDIEEIFELYKEELDKNE